jgi:plastocyanin
LQARPGRRSHGAAFSRAFKKMMGVPPSVVRRRQRMTDRCGNGILSAVRIAVQLSIAILYLLGACPALADTGHVITQKDREFHPDEITINRGDMLTFTNEDAFIHQIYVDGLFDTDERAPGENITETFTKSGTFVVRCHIHPKMKLIVHVR